MKQRRILRSILTPAARVLGRWAEGILREAGDGPVASDDGSLPATPENWLKLARVHAPQLLALEEIVPPGQTPHGTESLAPAPRGADDSRPGGAPESRREPEIGGASSAVASTRTFSRDDDADAPRSFVAVAEAKARERRRSPLLGQRPPTIQTQSALAQPPNERIPVPGRQSPREAAPLAPGRPAAESRATAGPPDAAFPAPPPVPRSSGRGAGPPRPPSESSVPFHVGESVAGRDGRDENSGARSSASAATLPERPPVFASATPQIERPSEVAPAFTPSGSRGTWSTPTAEARSLASRFPALSPPRSPLAGERPAPRATAPIDRWPSLPDLDLESGPAAPETERLARRMMREEQERSDP